MFNIPKTILEMYKKIQDFGFDVFFVGGSVRNLLMKRPVKDWDLTTNAIPEEILKIFPDGFYDNKFGTVGVPIEIDQQKIIVEITTFRTETNYSDKRHPDKIEWGKTIEEDVSRRDFTINAVALQCHFDPKIVEGKKSHHKFELVDPYEGQKDIEQKIIRAVGNPNQRFKEDALRLLRAVRIATELSFSIEEKTLRAVTQDARLIEHVSGERIRTELLRILESEFAYDGILLLKNTGLLEHILPELVQGQGVSQVRPGRHHSTDVFDHNVLSMKFCPSRDPIVKFATLLHDIGKPKVKGEDQEGFVIFHNHEVVGAQIAWNICNRLRFSKKERDKIVMLIRWHMFTVEEKATDSAIRRFIRRVGVENVKDIIDLRIGDRLGSGTQTAESWRLKLFQQRIEQQLKPKPFNIDDMKIDGNDIMKELNMKPGKKIGEILQNLFEEVDENLSKNNRRYLLKRVQELTIV